MLRVASESWRFANDDAGISQLLERLQGIAVAMVVEATDDISCL